MSEAANASYQGLTHLCSDQDCHCGLSSSSSGSRPRCSFPDRRREMSERPCQSVSTGGWTGDTRLPCMLDDGHRGYHRNAGITWGHVAESSVPDDARDRAIDAAVEAWLGDEWVSTLGPEERLLGVHALYPAAAAAVSAAQADNNRRIEAVEDLVDEFYRMANDYAEADDAQSAFNRAANRLRAVLAPSTSNENRS